jgi:hypothetical protein
LPALKEEEMKKLALSLAAAAAIAFTAPAFVQQAAAASVHGVQLAASTVVVKRGPHRTVKKVIVRRGPHHTVKRVIVKQPRHHHRWHPRAHHRSKTVIIHRR